MSNELVLNVRLTGRFVVIYHGESLTPILGQRARSILAYLLLHRGETVMRDFIAGNLWPEQSNEQARTNLRREIFSLRKASSVWKRLIVSGKQTITLSNDAKIETDVHRFYSLKRAFDENESGEKKIDLGRLAIACLHGELLVDFNDEWVIGPRLQLESAAFELAEQLLAEMQRLNHRSGAIGICETLIRYNPYSEKSYISLFQLYSDSGDRAMALHTYQRCELILERELGIAPGEELQRLYSSLFQREDHRSAKTSGRTQVGTGLIGREDTLEKVWQLIRSNIHDKPLFIVISGEAGIGKSRVLNALRSSFENQQTDTALATCHWGGNALSYKSVVDWFSMLSCSDSVLQLEESFRYELGFSLPTIFKCADNTSKVSGHAANRSRGRLFEALSRLLSLSDYPIVLFLDDLQWVDTDTMDWLAFLFTRSMNKPLCIVATLRHEDAWSHGRLKSHLDHFGSSKRYNEITIKPLNRSQIWSILDAPSTNALHKEEREERYEQAYQLSAGNPFYALEYMQVAVNGDVQKAVKEMPRKFNNLLSQRLLSITREARLVLDFASALGQPFSPESLQRMSEMSNHDFMLVLEELWGRGFLATKDTGLYWFKHQLIRDTHYSILSPPRREYLHSIVARIMQDSLERSGVGSHGQIAFHYEASGKFPEALSWYLEAAEVAERNMIHREAIKQCRHALSLIARIESSKDSVVDEVQLLLLLARQVSLLEGYSSQELADIYARLSLLQVQIIEPEIRHSIAKQKRIFLSFSDNPRNARVLAGEQIRFAKKIGDPIKLIESWRCKGVTEYQLGYFADCENSMDLAIELINQEQNLANISYEDAPFFVPVTHNFKAMVQLIQGEPLDSENSLKESAKYNVPYVESFVQFVLLMTQASVLQLMGEVDRVHSIAMQFEKLADIYYLPKMQCVAQFLMGWVVSEQGDPDQALSIFMAAHEGYPKNADHHMFPTWWAHRSDAEIRTGMYIEGLASIRESIMASQRTGQGTWLAEYYRKLGIALHLNGESPDDVRAAFDRSTEIARRQDATLFENRTEESKIATLLS